MTVGYKRAVILAGGAGTRLRRLGEVLAKCMIPVYDQPILIRQVEQAARVGVSEILVSVSSRFAPLVEGMLEYYKAPAGVSVRCIREVKPLGPIGGFLSLVRHFQDEPTVVILGDEYYEDDLPFDKLAGGLRTEDMVLGVVRTPDKARIDCVVIQSPSGEVERIKDKPLPREIVGELKWCGFVAFRAGIGGPAETAVRENLVPGKHIGDLFEGMRRAGASAGIIEFREVHLNLNSVDDVLRASLLEARKNWRREHPRLVPLLNEAIDALFRPTRARNSRK